VTALDALCQVLLLAAGLGGAVLCGCGGWRRGRKNRPAGLVVAGFAVLWGILLAGAGALAMFARDDAPDEARWIVVCVSLAVVSAAAVPAGFAIGMACASLARPRGD
jgi:hypothetical protein